MSSAALGAGLHASGQKHFEGGIRKHHRAHVAPVGHQAGRLAKIALALQERRAHAGDRRDFRGRLANLLAANRLAHVHATQQNAFVGEGDVQGLRQECETRHVIRRDARLPRGQAG